MKQSTTLIGDTIATIRECAKLDPFFAETDALQDTAAALGYLAVYPDSAFSYEELYELQSIASRVRAAMHNTGTNFRDDHGDAMGASLDRQGCESQGRTRILQRSGSGRLHGEQSELGRCARNRCDRGLMHSGGGGITSPPLLIVIRLSDFVIGLAIISYFHWA